jgi:hypothetical protein
MSTTGHLTPQQVDAVGDYVTTRLQIDLEATDAYECRLGDLATALVGPNEINERLLDVPGAAELLARIESASLKDLGQLVRDARELACKAALARVRAEEQRRADDMHRELSGLISEFLS